MAKTPSIQVMILLDRLKFLWQRSRKVISKVGIIRLTSWFVNAAWFQLQLSGKLAKPERFLVRLRESGDDTLKLACASVAGAELIASAQQIGELWYQIELTPVSKTLESIQELFAVVLLSERTQAFSIVLAGKGASQFDDLALSTFNRDVVAGASDSVAFLMDPGCSPAFGAILAKPFYQSEIGPNDYLKRASNGRKVVLVSISKSGFSQCWQQMLGHAPSLFGEDAPALFFLVDRSLMPQAESLPPGMLVQSLELLGFTGLERLALVRSVDFLVTDHAPYLLSALVKNATILWVEPHRNGHSNSSGNEQEIELDISKWATSGRVFERRILPGNVLIQQVKSERI